MHYSRIALAATPVFFAYVSAYGSAVIKNSCGDDVYFWSCGDIPGERITVPAGQSHSQGYYSKSGGGGPSLKIGVKYPDGPKKGDIPGIWDLPSPDMTQFEYTVGTAGPPTNAVFYDISNINGYPFMSGGVKMTSSDSSVSVACPKGVQYCQAAYNAPHDDHATGSAPDHLDLILELCSDAPGMIVGGGSHGSGGSGGGSSGSGGSGGEPSGSGTGSSGSSIPQQTSPQPSSSTPVASSSPQPSQSKGDPQSQNVAPEKLAVNAPAQKPTSPSSAPTSSITPPPEDVVVWQTVTAPAVVVTVHEKEKRHEHIHQHVHNKINKKRHGN